jgi:DNA repair exonuclease SbcCD ATPase subunit
VVGTLSDVANGQTGNKVSLQRSVLGVLLDEGFGGLDPESLELAIRTLIDLQQAGPMVGVISHVAEMKEQMELRVDIEKGFGVGHLKVVAPGIREGALWPSTLTKPSPSLSPGFFQWY